MTTVAWAVRRWSDSIVPHVGWLSARPPHPSQHRFAAHRDRLISGIADELQHAVEIADSGGRVQQSLRSAVIGSTTVARRAGIHDATSATPTSRTADRAIVGGSAGSMPKSNPLSSAD